MFAKLKKTIEVQNNRPAQVKSQHTSASVLNQNNSTATQAPVHHPGKTHILQKRSSQSESLRTSLTAEDFQEEHNAPLRQQTTTTEDATTRSSYVIRDKPSDQSKDMHVSKVIQAEVHSQNPEGDLHFDADELIKVLESPEFLEDFVSESMEQQQHVASHSGVTETINTHEDVNRRLSEAESRIKILEAELQEKTKRLEQHSKGEKHLIDHVEEIASLKRKVSDYESQKKKSIVDFDLKCQELAEVQKQLSTTKEELEMMTSRLTKSCHELDAAKEELRLTTLEKESLRSKVNELSGKLEDAKKERETQEDRFLMSMSELQTMAEVAEADRKELELRVLDMEKKFEEDLKVARIDSTNDLRKLLTDMEEQVREKNKLLKKQEHRLAELRKVVQKELSSRQFNIEGNTSNSNNNSSGNSSNNNNRGNSNYPNTSDVIRRSLEEAEEGYFNNSSDCDASVRLDAIARIEVTSNETSTRFCSTRMSTLDLSQDLNFKYLKHVILKFFLSREHEALQLIKVVSMLLRFNKEEEKMIRDTLQWRTSWFRSKPQLPEKGQSAIVVPALY